MPFGSVPTRTLGSTGSAAVSAGAVVAAGALVCASAGGEMPAAPAVASASASHECVLIIVGSENETEIARQKYGETPGRAATRDPRCRPKSYPRARSQFAAFGGCARITLVATSH